MRRAFEISIDYRLGRWFLPLAQLFQHRLDEALAVMKAEKAGDGHDEGAAIGYYAMRKKLESHPALKPAIGVDADWWPSAIAKSYAFRGNPSRQ